MKRYLYMALGCLSAGLGIVGVFVPVLPTTPLLLLAAFCFSRSSKRLDAKLKASKFYKAYVLPFKKTGGISAPRKAVILIMSYIVMGISAFFVRIWFVWVILAAVALWLAYLMLIRIPTISVEESVEAHGGVEQREEKRS